MSHDGGDETFLYHEKTGSPPIGANMFFRREAFQKYGNISEKMRIGTEALAEDTEICQRILRNGGKLRYIPEVVVFHPVDKRRLNKKYFREFYFKAGVVHVISHPDHSPATTFYFKVPRYNFKWLLLNFFTFLKNLLFFRLDGAFYFQLQCFYYCGIIYAYLHKVSDKQTGSEFLKTK